jgi:hypothetical protein
MTISVTHSKVSTIPDGTDTSVVRPSDWNATHTLVGVGTAASLDAGVANGVATLDSGGQIPLSQLPPLGDLNYQGTWNATTNSPTLTSSVGTKGYYYVVSVAGSTNLNGITDWKVSDWAVYNGTAWQKIDNTDAVTSVNGQTGAVSITLPGLGAGTIATQNANNVTITGGTLNAVAIGGSTAGDGTFDVLTANVTNLTNVTSSAGIVITGTFTGSSPTDGLVMDYSTGWGRFSDFGGDGFQWFNAGLATTKLMELSNTGALATTGTVTANGVLLTGNTGTVTGVTATSPVASSGGTAPVISMPAATTSVSGYLTSTDWNTFNSKGSGTVTSVTGTAPVVSSGGATPAISMAAANTTTNGYLTSTDWNTFNGKSNTNGTVTSVAALTLGTTGTDLSSTVATGTTTPVITLQVPTASASNRGALSSTDWSTFNGKQATLVSGTNIKTVAGVSLLGSGDVGLIGGTYGGTGVNNGSKTITLGGNLTTLGAFTTSFTASANTAVTLPAGATAASNNLLSSATAVGIVTGTPSSTTYLRGDGTWAAPSAAASGSNTQVQYNNSGALGANSNFTYDSSTGTLATPAVQASNGLVLNKNTNTTSYTIPTGDNAMSVGPFTTASGTTITVPSGSRWVIL